ncbi:uncharacterized protein LOC101731307 [Xenopus tropicalis]|uniref:Uncharacterized protein LOC101731307 n=1 Tax=Xenopus tropicalis TaxID=8364 RepID=A0A8J1IRP1_XENTR|nr:uncharacterized protein LOC101731307 [Xenopus tropicalis]
MAPCQPQEFLFVPVGGKAKISCVSNGTLDKLFRISWYRRTWRVGENPELILDWGEVTKGHKYNCTHTERSSSLEINNVKEEDSGTYYCAHFIYMSLIFSNGTTLIAGDSFTAKSSVHLMAPPSSPLPNTSVQLACVASAVGYMVHISWNLSGTPQKGRVVAMEEPGGTLTFLSYITVPRDTWYQGASLSCQVRFNSSSATAVHGQATRQEEVQFAHVCSFCIRSVLTGVILLALALAVHLSWTCP